MKQYRENDVCNPLAKMLYVSILYSYLNSKYLKQSKQSSSTCIVVIDMRF